jgi:regulator of protease activity HflC (stomatin/prohibitin superfamily)
MGGLVFAIVLLIVSLIIFKVKADDDRINPIKNTIASIMLIGSLLSIGFGAAEYNDAGYCKHVRTIFGSETSTCSTGWYFQAWGTSTSWPHYITVAHTIDPSSDGSAITGPYRVRLADNWSGDVSQTTRFSIPQDNAQFIAMARQFRSPERLITTTLKPAVTASLDSVANMFSMEEYYAGGRRDQFKSEYSDAITKGRALVRQVSVERPGAEQNRVAPNDSDVTADTSEVGDTNSQRVVMEKVVDEDTGLVIRFPHDYAEVGVEVASAILENLDPDDRFENQIQARKDAASRRIVAREERLEQEEQRLLAIQAGETEIAKRQASARTDQIQKTTEADTAKKLALIKSEQQREEARISKETSEINLEKAKIDADAKRVTAEAAAYEKEVILEADGALQQKLDALVQINRSWADAASKINVPATVFASGGAGGAISGNALGTVEGFMNIMTMKAAKDLQVDTTINK